jgi:hypothetical protein
MRRALVLAVLVAILAACEEVPAGGDTSDSGAYPPPPVATASGTRSNRSPEPGAATESRVWMDLARDLVAAEKLSPPAASRAYAYTALALDQAGSGAAGQPGLVTVLRDAPAFESPGDVDPQAAAAIAAAGVAKSLFHTDESWAAIDALLTESLADADPATRADSVAYGAAVSDALLDWAATDGFDDTRGRTHEMPTGDGLWVATGDAPPLEPYWGTMRPFALPTTEACRPPAPPEYSLDPDSAFWQQVQEVYDTTVNATEETMAIADFWADQPGETSTPPGHWVSITGLAAEEKGLDDAATARAYAATSVALADAFISTWEEKYRSNLVRPITLIQEQIDPDWTTHIPTPPFPEYTSGHSTASGAASVVLRDLMGYVPFEDTTHQERGLPSRRFSSFRQAAEEAAISRLYGGIHYRAAIEEGLEQGQCVGEYLLRAMRSAGQ